MSEETKPKVPIPYSEAETRLLKNIARTPRDNWMNKINPIVAKMPGRTRDTVYQKVLYEARKLGNTKSKKALKTSNKNHPVKAVKNAASIKNATHRPVLKSSKIHPMKSGSVKVSPTEIRFPYKEIRLENGEVIISI